MDNTNWQALILKEMKEHDESWADVVSCTLTPYELLIVFDCSYGHLAGKPFTLWTKKRVYFPETSDGAEWVSSLSRNPNNIATRHHGRY